MKYSAIKIREENILALRSFLLEGPQAWVPLLEKMRAADEAAAGYMSLLYGAFNVAVRRKFLPVFTIGEIVHLVADIRIKAKEDAHLINALVAEDMIRRSLDAPAYKGVVPNDTQSVIFAEIFVLLYLVAEADFDRAGLEQFIDEVTAYTEEWLVARRAEAPAAWSGKL